MERIVFTHDTMRWQGLRLDHGQTGNYPGQKSSSGKWAISPQLHVSQQHLTPAMSGFPVTVEIRRLHSEPANVVSVRAKGLQIECRRMFWLVESDLAAAGQLEGGSDAPAFLMNLRALDLLGFQEFDLRAHVVAHEIEHGPQQAMSVVLERPVVLVGGMKSGLGGRQFEDQPTVAGVDGREVQDVAKEAAIGFRVLAVEQEVRADDHAEECNSKVRLFFAPRRARNAAVLCSHFVRW